MVETWVESLSCIPVTFLHFFQGSITFFADKETGHRPSEYYRRSETRLNEVLMEFNYISAMNSSKMRNYTYITLLSGENLKENIISITFILYFSHK